MTTTIYENNAKIAVVCAETMHTLANDIWGYKAYNLREGTNGVYKFTVDLPLFDHTETVVIQCNLADTNASYCSAYECTIVAPDNVCYDLSTKIMLDDELTRHINMLLEPLYCIFGHSNVAVI